MFGLMTVLTLLSSCGGGGGSSSKENRFIDPQTADKMEQAIRSQKAGMVGIRTENGNSYYVDIDNNEVIVKEDLTNETDKETILKVAGDAIYTLRESFENGSATPYNRKVIKDSLERMVKELSEPLPEGTSVSVKNNILTIKLNFNYSYDYMNTGRSVITNARVNGYFTLNLDNPRCSSRSSSVTASSVKVDGVETKLPNSTSNSAETCGADLSQAQLRALDLSSIELCDESVDGGESETTCDSATDLSYLVN